MQVLVRFSELVIRLTFALSAILLALSAALVGYQVFTRFVLDSSAAWSEVLSRALIIWTVFLVFGPAIRFNRMIPIDAIRHLFPPKRRIWVIRMVALALLLVLGVLIWFGYLMTLRVVGQQVAMLNVSVAWLYAALPIGSLLALPGVFLAHLDAEKEHREILAAAS